MADKTYLLTPEGLEKLKAELQTLINERRKEVIERIQEAVAHGDLSENADYAQAKEEQSFIEGRIQEIEDMIKNAEIIDVNKKHTTVTIGSTVTVMVTDKEGKSNERKYTNVGANEANPAQNKISNESLVGKALLSRKVGEKSSVATPAGEMNYEIKQIE
jgi:transcription elongation factor GreA